MTLNAVYKKDAESVNDSVSPGITQDDIIGDINLDNEDVDQQTSSLVDIFIQNSKPSADDSQPPHHNNRKSGSYSSKRGPRNALEMPHGPAIGHTANNQSQNFNSQMFRHDDDETTMHLYMAANNE